MTAKTLLERCAIACFILLGVVLMSAFLTASEPTKAQSGPLSAEELMYGAIHADSHDYPAIVARVNGHAISGGDLATCLFMIAHTQKADVVRTYTPERVLHELITEEILFQTAEARGMSLGDDVIVARIQAMQRRAAESSDQAAKDTVAAAAKVLGLSAEQYAKDPRVIDLYRHSYLVGRVEDEIRKTLPSTTEGNDPQALQTAIDRFVTGSGSRVEVFLSPDMLEFRQTGR